MGKLINRILLAVVFAALAVIAGTLIWRALASPILCDSCNIVLISLDAVSSDDFEESFPLLAARAKKDGVTFTQAYSSARQSVPGQAALLTGEYPWRLGIWDRGSGIPTEVPTLAETLNAYGYYTAAFVQNPFIDTAWGFARGFDTWEQIPHEGDALEVAFSRAEEYATSHQTKDQPFFLYLQPAGFYELTEPDGTPGALTYEEFMKAHQGDEAAKKRFQAAYKTKLTYIDTLIEQLVTAAQKGSGKTIVIVTASFGQEFVSFPESGYSDAVVPRARALRVPLAFFVPGERGRVVDATVESRNVAETLLQLIGAESRSLGGTSLVPYLKGKTAENQTTEARFILSDVNELPSSPASFFAALPNIRTSAVRIPTQPVSNEFIPEGATRSLIQGDMHALKFPDHTQHLFDIELDPGETENLVGRMASSSFAKQRDASWLLGKLLMLR